METGVSFKMIKQFIKRIWIFVVLGMILGGVGGVVLNKVKGKNVTYQATASIFVDRNFNVDKNGNGFYDGDSNRFWANFMAFSNEPTFVHSVEKKYPDYDELILEKKFSEDSNLFQISYKATDKKEAIGIVNAFLDQVTTEADKYLSEKGKIVNTTKAAEDNLIEMKTSTLKADVMIGLIYGLIIGLIVGIVVLFLRKR